MNSWQGFHFVRELEGRGWHFVSPDPAANDDEDDLLLAVVDEAIKSKGETWFLTSAKEGELSQMFFTELRRHSIKSILLCYDNMQIPFIHKRISSFVDLVWLTSRENESLFRYWGAKTVFLPYAANPEFFSPRKIAHEELSVCFIGNPYGARMRYLRNLGKHNIKTNIFTANINAISHRSGPGFWARYSNYMRLMFFPVGRKCIYGMVAKKLYGKKIDEEILGDLDTFPGIIYKPQIPFEDIPFVYSTNALAFANIELWDTYCLKKPLYKIHLRTFEIPMCGGIQLVNDCAEIREYFEPDKEVLLYTSVDEALEKCIFYLHPKWATLRKNIREAARRRALSEHTWRHRFEKIKALLQ